MASGTQVASLFGVVSLDDKATGALNNIKGAFGQLGGLIGGLSFVGIFGAAIKAC